MNAASLVFAIPELLEKILLSLPNETSHEEIRTTRFIRLSRTVCRTWHDLITDSTSLRQHLFLPTKTDKHRAEVYGESSAFPNAHPNPWIPHLLLNQRSWGSAYPFETMTSLDIAAIEPMRPRHWKFSFEISRAQYERLPQPGNWREMLVSQPPFQHFWFTRSFYELGSGRAPFVTYLDYNPRKPKAEQAFVRRNEGGVTLGMIADAVSELFERYPRAKFVMIESIKPQTENFMDESPRTCSYLPGSSAERAHGWKRGE